MPSSLPLPLLLFAPFLCFANPDINELNLPKTCDISFSDPDDLLNFKLVICPDEVRAHSVGLPGMGGLWGEGLGAGDTLSWETWFTFQALQGGVLRLFLFSLAGLL